MCRTQVSVDLEKPRQNSCENMSKITLYVIAKVKLCGFHDFFYKIEGQLQYGMLQIIASWSQWAGYEVLEAGDDITDCLEERTLLLTNHQATGDVLMLFNAFVTRSEILPNTMWIMDSFLKYSTFGIVCTIRRDFFISQGRDTREKSVEALSKHLYEAYLPLKRKWLGLFPEGGFLYKRKASSQRYAQKNNLPHLENVTIPRMGAFQVIMEGLHPKRHLVNNNYGATQIPGQDIRYILDVTIGYQNAEPISVLAILFGYLPPCQTTVFYRLYPIDEVPPDQEGYSQWLLDRWVEKDEMLETFYQTGEFPLGPNSKRPTLVKQTRLHILALHFAFIISCYFHYRIFMALYHYCSS